MSGHLFKVDHKICHLNIPFVPSCNLEAGSKNRVQPVAALICMPLIIQSAPPTAQVDIVELIPMLMEIIIRPSSYTTGLDPTPLLNVGMICVIDVKWN